MCDDDGERAAVVVDNGSLVSRAGFAGCDSPSAVLPSVVATRCSGPRLGEVVYAGEEAKSRVRGEAERCKSLLLQNNTWQLRIYFTSS